MDFAVQYRFGAYSAEVITGDDRDAFSSILFWGLISRMRLHAMKEAFVNKYNTADLSAGMITGNVMGIYSKNLLKCLISRSDDRSRKGGTYYYITLGLRSRSDYRRRYARLYSNRTLGLYQHD